MIKINRTNSIAFEEISKYGDIDDVSWFNLSFYGHIALPYSRYQLIAQMLKNEFTLPIIV